MNTTDPIQKITAAQARDLLPELELSDLSVAEFARQRNVDHVPLYNARRASRMATSKASREKFAQVTIQDRETAPTAGGSAIEIELPNRYRLRVPAGFDEVNLRRVLTVIGSC